MISNMKDRSVDELLDGIESCLKKLNLSIKESYSEKASKAYENYDRKYLEDITKRLEEKEFYIRVSVEGIKDKLKKAP